MKEKRNAEKNGIDMLTFLNKYDNILYHLLLVVTSTIGANFRKVVFYMKKSFWGYNIQEVDENIQYLESVNETLSKKVSKLTTELDEYKDKLESAEWNMPAFDDIGTASDNSADVHKLMETIDMLTEENNSLKQQNVSLHSRNTELESEVAELREASAVGSNGFADIQGARATVNEQLHDYVQAVLPEVQDKMALMEAAQKKVIEICAGARENFLDAADAILEQYDSFIGHVKENNEINGEYLGATEALRRELDDTIDTYLPPEPEIEYVQEPEPEKAAEIDSHRVLQDIISRASRRDTTPAPVQKETKPEPKQEPSIVRISDKVKGYNSPEVKQEAAKSAPAVHPDKTEAKQDGSKLVAVAHKETAEPKQEAAKLVAVAHKETAEVKQETVQNAPAAHSEPEHRETQQNSSYSGSLFETTDINDIMHG